MVYFKEVNASKWRKCILRRVGQYWVMKLFGSCNCVGIGWSSDGCLLLWDRESTRPVSFFHARRQGSLTFHALKCGVIAIDRRQFTWNANSAQQTTSFAQQDQRACQIVWLNKDFELGKFNLSDDVKCSSTNFDDQFPNANDTLSTQWADVCFNSVH